MGRRFWIILLVGFLPVSSLAQPDAGSLSREDEEAQGFPQPRIEAPDAEPAPPALTDLGETTVEVASVRFTGATELVDDEVLQDAVEPGIGEELDFDGLRALAERVTRALKDAGWFLARGYLPEQDVSDGVIEIRILAGRLDSEGPAFEIRNAGERALRIDPGRLRAMAASELEPGEPLRTAPLDRAILLMDDLPGLKASATLAPGDAPDSTRVVVNAEQDKLLNARLGASNFGNRSTGRGQLTAQLRFADPSGRGDEATLDVTHAEGLEIAGGRYEFPIGYQGLRVHLGARYLGYEVVEGTEEDLAAELNGRNRSASAGLEYPLIRQRRHQFWAEADYAYSAPEDFGGGEQTADKRVSDGGIALRSTRLDTAGGGGQTRWRVRAGTGKLNLARNDQSLRLDQSASGYDTNGSYATLNYRLSRLQRLDGAMSLFGEWEGQKADSNLDSSQKFYPAGPNGVRAYPGGEASADEGDRLRLELRYDDTAPWGLGQLQYKAFFDRAWVRLHHDPMDVQIASETGRNTYRITGAGLGITLSEPGRYYIRLLAAKTLGDNPGRSANGNNSDGRDDDERVWLQGVWWL